MRSTFALVLLATLATAARADELHVPQDFPTIQAAVDAAAPLDTILIAPGLYAEQVVISGKTSLFLRGQGQATITGGQALQPSVLIEGSTHVQIDRLRFQDVLGDAVSIVDSTNVGVTHCRFEGTPGTAISATGTFLVIVYKDVIAGAAGAGLLASGCDYVHVDHCKFLDGEQGGIQIQDGTGHTIRHVTVKGSGAVGIVLQGVSTCSVEDSLVRDAGGSALVLEGDALHVEHNRLIHALGDGLVLEDGLAGVLRKNRIVGGSTGLRIGGGQHQVLDNRIVGTQLGGLVCEGDACLVSGNRVLKVAGDAYDFTDKVEGGTILDCIARDAGEHGFELAGAELSITGNTCVGAQDTGFVLTSSGNVLMSNTAHGNVHGSLKDDAGGNVYIDNHFQPTKS